MRQDKITLYISETGANRAGANHIVNKLGYGWTAIPASLMGWDGRKDHGFKVRITTTDDSTYFL